MVLLILPVEHASKNASKETTVSGQTWASAEVDDNTPRHPASSKTEGARESSRRRRGSHLPQGKGLKKIDWTPWKDRVRGHKDAVLFVEVINDRGVGDEISRRCLVTVSADGALRVLELEDNTKMVAKRKLALTPPASLQVRSGAPFAAWTAENSLGVVSPSRAGTPFLTAFTHISSGQHEPVTDLSAQEVCTGVGIPMVFGGYECGRICGWALDNGRIVFDFPGHEMPITALRVQSALPKARAASTCSIFTLPNPKGHRPKSDTQRYAMLLSASLDGTVRGWRVHLCLDSGSLPGTMLPAVPMATTSPEVEACLFILEFGARNPVVELLSIPHSGGARMLAGSWDGRLRTIDLESRSCVAIIDASSSGICSLCIDESGVTAYVGTFHCYICVWKLALGAGTVAHQVLAWKAHNEQVSHLRRWQGRLISASEDRLIKMWNAETGQLGEEFYGHSGAVLTMCISAVEQLLWTGSRDHSVRSWDLAEASRRIEERARMQRMDYESKLTTKEANRILKEAKKSIRASSKKAKKKKDKIR